MCVPKTSSVLIARPNRLNVSGDDRAAYDAATKIAAFAGAKIFWVAVTVDAKARLFSAYMGEVAKLPSPKCIPMHPTRDVSNYKCLARDQHDDGISETWSNVVGTVSA